MFIELPRHSSSGNVRPVWINANQVLYFEPHNKGTRIVLGGSGNKGGDSKIAIIVQADAQEVAALIQSQLLLK